MNWNILFSDNNFLEYVDINIGNSSNINEHKRCGGQSTKVDPETNVTIPCDRWGRHVSIRKYGGNKKVLLFCEVFVIGYKHIGKCNTCLSAVNVSYVLLFVNHNIKNILNVILENYNVVSKRCHECL